MNKIPTPNPYDVLEVSPEASNKEITIAFAMAMKKRKYSTTAIAIARKSLIDPQERIVADYLRPILPAVKNFTRSDFSKLNTPTPKIEFLPEFNGLEAAIHNSHKISSSDKRLGEALFPLSPTK